MTNENEEKKKSTDQNKDAAVKPDPETLHTTDPQKKMEGPVSSLVNSARKNLGSHETQEEADKKKDEHM